MGEYKPPVDRDEFYDVYEAHAKILRAWLVAYGVGGPVLILTNDSISTKVVESGLGEGIAVLFLSGVGLQILVSLVNKWVNWGVYAYSATKKLSKGKRYALCDWLSEQFWFDILLDVGSVICFAVATWRMVSIFT
ncbi:MAG: hypothetical protein GY838_01130 [bacterium]|nr:hypothetical protein [bacterium]